MRIFADTNFLLSAFATRGLSADVFELVISSHELVVSDLVMLELRGKLTEKFKVPDARIREIELFLSDFLSVRVEKKSSYVLRDKDDEWILAAAIFSGSEILITGDKDLLSISDAVKELKIVTPRQFWEMTRI